MKNFFCKYKYLLIAILGIILTVTLLLLFFAGGPKKELKKLIDRLSPEYSEGRYATAISDAKELYEDSEATDKDIEKMIAVLEKIITSENEKGDGLHYYEGVSITGVQNWTEEDCTIHNFFPLSEISISKKCLVGSATQSISIKKLDDDSFYLANVDISNSANGGAMFGDIFEGNRDMLEAYDGLRIALTDKYGFYPELTEAESLEFKIFGDSSVAGALPTYTFSVNGNNVVFAEGYLYLPFDKMVSSWDENESFATIPYTNWYNGFKSFSLKLTGKNIAKRLGNRLYLSDMQVYSIGTVLPREELSTLLNEAISLDKDGKYSEELNAAKAVCDNSKASQAELDSTMTTVREIHLNLSKTTGKFDSKNTIFSFGAGADPLQEAASGEVKLLMIGNSFSVNAYNYISRIAEAEGVKLTVANLNYPGCNLERHYRYFTGDAAEYGYSCSWGETKHGYTASQALADQDWDFVSIQQVSGYSGDYDSYQPYLHDVVSYIREHAPQAEIIWHQTWAYQKTSDHSDFPKYDRDQTKMWEAIEAASKKAAETEGLSYIVPSGKAFQLARASAIGDNLNSDGYHANALGEYLAGYCFFSTVTGNLPDENSYRLDGVTDQQHELLKKAVTDAVNEYGYASYDKSSAYYSSLKKFNSVPLMQLDGFLLTGKLEKETQADLDAFVAASESLINNGNVFFAFDESFGGSTLDRTALFESFAANDKGAEEQKLKGNRHTVINGVHLLSLTCSSAENGVAQYSEEALTWLEAELSAITDKLPVFLATAYPVKEGDPLSAILKKQGNVISLSDYGSEAVKENADFTAVSIGSLSSDAPTASLISVDKDGNVRIRSFELSSGKEEWHFIDAK